MYYKTRGYRIFNVFNTCFLILLALMCIVPLIHVLAVSFSAKSAADANLVGLWPKQFSLEAYKKTINNPIFLHSIWVSVQRTILGTGLTLLITFWQPIRCPKKTQPSRAVMFTLGCSFSVWCSTVD